jgi:hypothetical protein
VRGDDVVVDDDRAGRKAVDQGCHDFAVDVAHHPTVVARRWIDAAEMGKDNEGRQVRGRLCSRTQESSDV